MAKNPQNEHNLPRHQSGTGSGDELGQKSQNELSGHANTGASEGKAGPENDRIDPQAGKTVAGASRQPVTGGTEGDPHRANPSQSLVEGSDADKRRIAEQQIDRENRIAAAAPRVALEKPRKEAIDRLEAEIRRHELVFDDFSGGLIHSEPVFRPMDLHELRVKALRVLNTQESTAEQMHKMADELAAVRFSNETGVSGKADFDNRVDPNTGKPIAGSGPRT